MNKPVLLFLLFLAVVDPTTASIDPVNRHPESFSDRSQTPQKNFRAGSLRRRLEMYAPQYVAPAAYSNPRFLTNNPYQTVQPQTYNSVLPQIELPQMQSQQNLSYQTRDLAQNQMMSNGGNPNYYPNQQAMPLPEQGSVQQLTNPYPSPATPVMNESPRELLAKIARAANMSVPGITAQNPSGANPIPQIQVQRKLTNKVVRPKSKEDLGLMKDLLSALKENTLQKIDNCAKASNLDTDDNRTICVKCDKGYSPINKKSQCAPSCIDDQCNPGFICLKEKLSDPSGGCVGISGSKKLAFCESLKSTLLKDLDSPKCSYCQADYVLVKNRCIKACDCRPGKVCTDCGASGFCDLSVKGSAQGFCRVLSESQKMKGCKNYLPAKVFGAEVICGQCKEGFTRKNLSGYNFRSRRLNDLVKKHKVLCLADQ